MKSLSASMIILALTLGAATSAGAMGPARADKVVEKARDVVFGEKAAERIREHNREIDRGLNREQPKPEPSKEPSKK